jgi:hypothetical protein
MNQAQSVPKNEKEKRPAGLAARFRKLVESAKEGEIAARSEKADNDKEFKRLWDLLMVASGQSIYSIAINSPSLNEEDKSFLKETKKRGL